ncbi:hypothetical protein [Methylobacterium brachythecii]|uniref:Uncharacterized protein n=1 Tax=Methylobacterium brachythecii TaxID=1176177 RepID=A0A7W6ADN2_9HYPH|nr:hypothetical protein [Methylobacterium brachythecii]MBB3901360.1 hypothetical protein [Methylobacterium brachythecii]GLS42935.1 hypothetical protein GCM10007884_09200 [Methylobacterium brachythecii]
MSTDLEAKQKALKEIERHRDKKRTVAALQRSEILADEEIEREILRQRDERARKALISAERDRIYAERAAALAALAETEARVGAADLQRFNTADSAERSLAKRLYGLIGPEILDLTDAIRNADPKLLAKEIGRVPQDIRDEAQARASAQRYAQIEAAALVIPETEDDTEEEILARYGISGIARRRAELDAGAL